VLRLLVTVTSKHFMWNVVRQGDHYESSSVVEAQGPNTEADPVDGRRTCGPAGFGRRGIAGTHVVGGKGLWDTSAEHCAVDARS
jgi:hypothetical protein